MKYSEMITFLFQPHYKLVRNHLFCTKPASKNEKKNLFVLPKNTFNDSFRSVVARCNLFHAHGVGPNIDS